MTTNLSNPISRAAYERELDLALAASFPASDPLPWTLGVEVDRESHRAAEPAGTVRALPPVVTPQQP
jgi:hypothetical protein